MSNCCANSASVLSPRTAAKATFALKAGMWFRRSRLVMVSPVRHASWPLSGRSSTYPAVQISRDSSLLHHGRQGNRISDLGEDFGEICVLPSRPLDLDAQGALGRLLANEIEGHVTEDSEVVGAIIQAISGIVFVHDDVEAPVQAVFDRPVRAGDMAEALGRQRRAEQVVGRLGGHLGAGLPGSDHLADGVQAGPVVNLLQPSDVG